MSDPTAAAPDFADRYATGQTPWEIGEPQPAFVENADLVTGRTLDLGCGTGELAVWFAGRGVDVVGVDPEPAAVGAARAKAEAAGVDAEFRVGSALELSGPGLSGLGPFDTVFDCLLFHIFDDEQRAAYAASARAALRPGGRLLMLVFSDAEPPGNGPRRVSEAEVRACFAEGFEVEVVEATRLQMRPEDAGLFSSDRPHGLWAVLRRE